MQIKKTKLLNQKQLDKLQQDNHYNVIPNYSDYFISKGGNVVSNKRGRFVPLFEHDNGTGYMFVVLTDNNGIAKERYIHRLNAITHIPNPMNKPEVNHMDGNTKNNDISNLEWVTRHENIKHRMWLDKLRRSCGNRYLNHDKVA